MNRDQIKYAAMFTMLLNHIANIFLEPGTFLFEVMVDVGYFTAITMCYFLVEGYGYTRSKEKYGKRLLLFALISEIPFCLAFTEEGTISFVNMNMLFTLFLCFLILYAMEKIPSGTRRILCILGLVFASAYSDWALLAPIFTYWFASGGLRDAQGKMLPAGGRNADQKSHLAGGQNPERKKLLWKVFRKAMLFFGLLNLVETWSRPLLPGLLSSPSAPPPEFCSQHFASSISTTESAPKNIEPFLSGSSTFFIRHIC